MLVLLKNKRVIKIVKNFSADISRNCTRDCSNIPLAPQGFRTNPLEAQSMISVKRVSIVSNSYGFMIIANSFPASK